MKTLKIVFKNKEEAINELSSSIKEMLSLDIKNAKEITEVVMVFESFERFKKIVMNRLDVLIKIKTAKPHSVYGLAKLLNKPQPSVLLDCQILEKLGLVRFKKEEHNGRSVHKPFLAFDCDVISIDGYCKIDLNPGKERKKAA